ncbi:hypothetical protein M569_05104 [Genlisea aurea]|uniref:SOSEKI DIX-like domain-containing protein n=1 Tax=Genlisea aurea TaxID=192259 RepID=S8E1W3_9LAMI|nr:hypothetical protein M569_05104 [Genlisea aurea]
MRTPPPAFKKVEIVYYLTRNGHLEHPHFMEISYLAHHQLRLRDFIERLTVLRGEGISALYSWSCKRVYKNGYVWNDLGENDVIYPSERDEYVLKGSELMMGSSSTEKQGINNGGQHRRYLTSRRRPMMNQEISRNQVEIEVEEEEEDDTALYARCSRGVSTDEMEEEFKNQNIASMPTEMIVDPNSFSISPPSTTSSDNSNGVKTYEDGDPLGTEPMLSRNSMLLNLIACGGQGSFRKTVNNSTPQIAGRKSGSLHKEVVCKAAAAAATTEDEDMINYMPENPRFGNLQSEEKEYFSGSIVESMTTEQGLRTEPVLKKSSSYNQEK